MHALARFLPFLGWFPLRADALRADLVAGITVALVLIPQSMAYAQLAGLPAYYGLYAAFLPVMVAAMLGSSHQLATGPVAVVSLLTASTLAPMAATGSEHFIALAIALALMVGVIQLALGAFRLGVVVNFLSHPVIVGFTNAAALIIALSQLNKMLGVSMGRSESFLHDIWGVVQQVGDTHLPTLALGVLAILIMAGLKKLAPKAPGVLIAVVVTTTISWTIGFERKATVPADSVMDGQARSLLEELTRAEERVADIGAQIASKSAQLRSLRGEISHEALTLNYEIELLRLQLKDRENENRGRSRALRSMVFERVAGAAGAPDRFYAEGHVPEGEQADGHRWRIARASHGELRLRGGGEVVGVVPEGLPALKAPQFSLDTLASLLSGALVISLVGFMEAISIAKAIAAKTKQRLDPNQELIGQGIANIVGSFSQAYPASGSFSRSAVNLNAGARTGMSSVVTGLVVALVLLFMTPLLYHLPQSVLAAIIMMAVVGLVNVKGVRHAWQAQRHDGIAAIATFVTTLAFAPHLDTGILAGAGLAVLLYLYRSMKPRVAVLGRHPDGTLRDVAVHDLPVSEHVLAVRFDGQLYFANVPYFEDTVLDVASRYPKARWILIVGDGINQLDASGEEVIHHLVDRLQAGGVNLAFSGLKKQVLDVMRATGLYGAIGEDRLFANEDLALEAIFARVDDPAFVPEECPLHRDYPARRAAAPG